jgi:diacylglycerol kinase family enzyme
VTLAAIVPAPDKEDELLARPSPKVHVIVNLRAGTALGLSPDAMGEIIRAPFEHQGHRIAVECLQPDAIEAAIARAAASDIDALIIGGGDGTIRTAAKYLLGSEKALGILPLGTMNRLAKDLEIPLTLPEAAAYLAAATPSKIDVAKVNDSIFLCNSVMGATLRYSVGRARLRGRPVLERIPKYFSLIRGILSSRRTLSIVVDNGDERLAIRALSVAVTNNGYDESTTWLRRPKLDGGKLTMYVSKHRNGWGMAKALARALIGRWHGDPEMAKLTGTSFVIHSTDRRKRLANDGEISKFDTPLRYEILPRALTVLTKDAEASA